MFHSLPPEETSKLDETRQANSVQPRFCLSSLCISFRSAFQNLGAMAIPANETEQFIQKSEQIRVNNSETRSLFSRALTATTEVCKSIYTKTVEVVTDVVAAVIAVNAEEQNNQKQTTNSTPSTAQRIFETIPAITNNQPSHYFSQDKEENKKERDDTATNAPARDGSRFLLSLVGKTYQLGVIAFVSPYYLLESVRNGKINPMLLEKLNLDVLTRSAEAETLSGKASIDKSKLEKLS